MSVTAPFGALLRNEVRLLGREPAPVIWAVLLPFAAAVVTALVPALGVRHDYLEGLTFAQVYQPVLVLFTSSTLALQVLPTIVTQYREYGVLRRLRTTPAPPWQLLSAVVTLVLGVSLLMGALLVVAPAVLGVPLPGNPAGFMLMTVLAAISLLSLGALLCGVARSTRVAAGIGGFVAACTWFAAGMWIPKAVLPPMVASIADLTPGGAAAEGMLRSLSGGWPELSGVAVLLVWTVVGFGVAARTFRFEAAR